MDRGFEPLLVEEMVRDAAGHVRWVVVAAFVASATADPVCVDYRVHVVRAMATPMSSYLQAKEVLREMQRDLSRPERPGVWLESAVGSSGIPRRVFEEASQARLLARARAQLAEAPGIKEEILELAKPGRRETIAKSLNEKHARTVGRPPTRDRIEDLKILAAIEKAFADGGTLTQVADEYHLSRSNIRNLLTWARHAAIPPWFTTTTQGQRGGSLTPHARALLREALEND